MNPIVILGLGALVLWYLSQSGSTALPADVVYVGAIPAGQTVSGITGPTNVYYSPSTKLYYPSTQAPTPAQVTAGSSILSSSNTTATTTATTTPVTTPVSSPLPNNTVTPVPAAGLPSLTSLAASIQAGAATDPNFVGGMGTGYRWQTYLNLAMLAAQQPAPTTPANFDLSQNMTFATYWATMGPYLTQTYGMSGLGLLGALSGRGFQNYGGWAA